MSNELVPCPYCGSEIKLHQCIGQDRYDFDCDCEYTISIWAETEQEAIAALNRRFVCLDKNGQKVFVGDEVWLEFSADMPREIRATITADMVHGLLFTTGTDAWDWADVPRIELIKEDT